MSLKHGIAGLAALALTGLFGSRAWAGQPEPWQFGFQDAVTPVMERIDSFHNMLLIILSAISAFVVILLAIVIFRFNAKRNPTPRKFSHNTLIETLWTGIPIIILIVIPRRTQKGYVRTLAGIARLLNYEETREALVSAASQREVMSIIQAEESKPLDR